MSEPLEDITIRVGVYNGEKTAPLTSSCVLVADFVSHRFTDPISSIPESGKGKGECVVSMRDFNHKKVTQSRSLARIIR